MGQVTKLGCVSHVIKKSGTSFRHFRHVTDKLQTSRKHVSDKSGDFFCLKHVCLKHVFEKVCKHVCNMFSTR